MKDFEGLRRIYFNDGIWINLGCGNKKRKDYKNIDIRKECNPDIIYDLNKGIPFKDNSVSRVYAKMILEHMNRPEELLKEIVRVCKDNAQIAIIVPHANSYASNSDLTHKSKYTENSFNKEVLETIGIRNLKLIRTEFLYNKRNKWKIIIPYKGLLRLFLNGIYDDIKFYLEVNKLAGEKLI